METEITEHGSDAAWQLIPQSGAAVAVLGFLFLYLMVRHLVFVLMFMDVVLGLFRKFGLVPKEGKRMKAFGHWLVAVILFAGYLFAARQFGWIEFVPV